MKVRVFISSFEEKRQFLLENKSLSHKKTIIVLKRILTVFLNYTAINIFSKFSLRAGVDLVSGNVTIHGINRK